MRHSRCRTSASIKPLPGRNSDIRVQLLPSGMGAPQRTTACDFSEPGAFCTAWDNVWRRWPEHVCPPDGKADFHGDRGDVYSVHRPTGCFPVAFVRASDHSLSLACRSRCGDKGHSARADRIRVTPLGASAADRAPNRVYCERDRGSNPPFSGFGKAFGYDVGPRVKRGKSGTPSNV